MRRLIQLLRSVTTPWLLAVMYLVWRTTFSYARPQARFPDSVAFDTLRFIGSNDRFWSVPLIFSLTPTDTAKVVVHILVGAFAWLWLARTLAHQSRYPTTIRVMTLAVGLSPQVVRYDLAILSESLGISFAVMAVAASLTVARSRTATTSLVWIISVLLCVMTRPTHLVIIAVAGIAMLTLSVFRRQPFIRPATIFMTILALWGGIQLTGNAATSTLNFYTVLAEQVIPHDNTYNWFVANGMPDISGIREVSGYDFAGDLPADLADLVALPSGQQPPALMRAGGITFANWVINDGWNTYTKYLMAHKSDTWQRVSHFAQYTLGPSNDDFLPLENRSSFPRGLFGPWLPWGIVASIGLATSAIIRRRQEFYALSIISVCIFMIYVATVLTSGIEHQRHAVTIAVMVRVIALAAVALVIQKSGRPTAPVSPDAEASR